MEKFFYPESIVILGLSAKENNLSRLILGNLIRWGYSGRIFGVNPRSEERHVDGIKMYRHVAELPEVPDLAVALLPARFIPEAVRSCGMFGISRMAIPSGGFNEAGEAGKQLAEELQGAAREYNIRFIGPNGLTIVNTANGLCLPFTPLYCPPKGGMSIITQSGGMGLFLWNLMADQNIGLAKFASIGNKLNLNEVDFLKYFARDPETKIICLYVESITDGRALLEAAAQCEKPVVIYKSNTTRAGGRAAMSHTAAISNDEEIIDAAFERAGIIRIHSFHDFISVTKAFSLPAMRGKRIMAMSPAGGFSVIMADLCDKAGFSFADPGQPFYDEIAKFGNAGIINVGNPLDMGDMYDPKSTADIFHLALHNDNVDGAIFINQWPRMPVGDDIFTRMFHTDLSQETMGAVRSSGKPLGVCLFGPSDTITRIKHNLSIPIFDSPEEMIRTLKIQQEFYQRKSDEPFSPSRPQAIYREDAAAWLQGHRGICGEETIDLLGLYGIAAPAAHLAKSVEDAVLSARAIGYPVVMKVVSPDAVHKSEAGGVMIGLRSDVEVAETYAKIGSNLAAYKPGAQFEGVRIIRMAPPGYDMFVGGRVDDAFGPVVFFGYGGIYVEIFNDTERALCPTNHDEITAKLGRLKSYSMLQGARGQKKGDMAAFTDLIVRVSWLLADFPQIRELDLNPVRVFGEGVMALDGRARITG
ncbi:acetate--CoA ligase family protein [Desulfopila aestuarii]|uniref:Acetyltransferase n=1 Tax=Desulfopila aestuarii DSM 18488 TaxID=1121416 RepID=A0A1M7Y8V9_9BACT|nr:acetate--CoA ligase [Desulfopila aestuarii]SHO48986.1 acetyltransferase [Desulfopila aestuarii DSM 18488]